jgi:hypothetical protein
MSPLGVIAAALAAIDDPDRREGGIASRALAFGSG